MAKNLSFYASQQFLYFPYTLAP